jgi:hypothetical protein
LFNLLVEFELLHSLLTGAREIEGYSNWVDGSADKSKILYHYICGDVMDE